MTSLTYPFLMWQFRFFGTELLFFTGVKRVSWCPWSPCPDPMIWRYQPRLFQIARSFVQWLPPHPHKDHPLVWEDLGSPACSFNALNNKENNHECDTNTHSISFNHIHICRIYSNDSTQWVHIVIIGIWCVYLIQEFTQYIPQDRPRKQQKRSSRNAKHRMVLSKLMGSWSTMLAMVSSVPNGAKMVPKCGLASSFVRHCAAQVA